MSGITVLPTDLLGLVNRYQTGAEIALTAASSNAARGQTVLANRAQVRLQKEQWSLLLQDELTDDYLANLKVLDRYGLSTREMAPEERQLWIAAYNSLHEPPAEVPEGSWLTLRATEFPEFERLMSTPGLEEYALKDFEDTSVRMDELDPILREEAAWLISHLPLYVNQKGEKFTGPGTTLPNIYALRHAHPLELAIINSPFEKVLRIFLQSDPQDLSLRYRGLLPLMLLRMVHGIDIDFSGDADIRHRTCLLFSLFCRATGPATLDGVAGQMREVGWGLDVQMQLVALKGLQMNGYDFTQPVDIYFHREGFGMVIKKEPFLRTGIRDRGQGTCIGLSGDLNPMYGQEFVQRWKPVQDFLKSILVTLTPDQLYFITAYYYPDLPLHQLQILQAGPVPLF